jgi:hypothetical protein
MKRFLALVTAAVLTLGSAACRDATSPGGQLAGSYTLRSISDQGLPVVVYADATLSEAVLGGQITLDRSGNYTNVTTYRDTYTNGSAPYTYDETIYGYWSLSGDQLTLVDESDPGNPYYPSYSNGQIVFTGYGSGGAYTQVYSR